MAYDVQNIIGLILVGIGDFWNSSFMLVVKILAGIYLAILIADVIMLLILKDVPSQIRTGLRGMDIPLASKTKMQRRWDKIKSRLRSDNPAQYKLAIIEADAIADELLSSIGFKGSNMFEKLESVGSAHLDNHLEALKGVHQIRNRIIHEENFEVDERMANAVLQVYEEFLRYLEYLK